MVKWKSAVLLVVVCGTALPEAQAYRYCFTAKRDGHLKAWWTKDKQRVSEHSFVNNDMKKGESVDESSPDRVANDADEEWTDATNAKDTDTRAFTGTDDHYYSTFEDMFAVYGQGSSWFALVDSLLISDLSVDVDLVLWEQHLESHPFPDDTLTFGFVAGECADLPGHYATTVINQVEVPFDGSMIVAGTSTVVPEPSSALMIMVMLGGLGSLRRGQSITRSRSV